MQQEQEINPNNQKLENKFCLVLENIRSAWNVGAIIRSCDAMGFDIILVGYTPLPVGKTLELVKKTAIGAENTVVWQAFEHSIQVFNTYPNDLHYGIEIDKNSQDIFDYLDNKLNKDIENNPDSKIFLWLGNEIHGLSDLAMSQTRANLYLPMKGKKESLNVSSTACAAGYLFLKQKY